MKQPEPGLTIGHKVGEGVRLNGPNEPIEVRVMEIGGTVNSRSAVFSVKGVPDIPTLHLTASHKFHKLSDDVLMRVENNPAPYINEKDILCVRYLVSSDYIIGSL